MITVNKEILLHSDFTENFADKLCAMLEDFMDEIFESDEELDFDFIDECADVINALRSGDMVQILPVISRNEFFEKLNTKSNNKPGIVAAAVAVAVLILIAGTQIKTSENVSVIRSLSGIVSEFFNQEQIITETTTELKEIKTKAEESSTPKDIITTETKSELVAETYTQETIDIKNISIQTTSDFRTEYYVGEKFSGNGIKVFAEYTNGERKLIQPKDYIVEVSKTFGTEAKYETIIIKSNGFTEKITVRVIENTSTKKLNSIYAVFPDTFDFTAENLETFRCDSMQVYALYSDGSERELKKGEYTVSYEHIKTLFKETLNVTIEYEDCFCTFAVSKK